MKKPNIWLLLFFVLILALATGLSYLSLHHVSKSKDEQDDKKMDVALVDEDDGTSFNQEEKNFGDQFVKSVDKKNEHDWHVVSRGVAENGLDSGTYDMMLVIPNDFSEKALSMRHSEDPEQVELDYKVNASDNDKVQAEAEETASSILNNFNQEIIDVYFASVISNLHDAQDNIGELIKEEAEHTYTYNDSIHNPLSNYTDRFEAVKDNTDASKDSFNNLEDLLDTFEESLTEQVDSNEDYQSNVEDVADEKESNNDPREEFLSQLNDFDDGLSNDEVEEQLEDLENANEYINTQFKTDDEDEELESIALDTEALKDRLEEALEQVDEAHEELEEELDEDEGKVNQEIEERLEKIIGKAFDNRDNDDDNELKNLFDTQDERMRYQIEEQIKDLPSQDEDDIEKSDLSSETKQEIKKVIKLTEKYNNTFETVEPDTNDDDIPNYIHELEEELRDEGITMTDSVEIPENKKADEIFHIDLKDILNAFDVEDFSLTFNDEEVETEGLKAVIPAEHDDGELEVTLKLKLKDDERLKEHDIFSIPKWSWKLTSEDVSDDEKDDEGSESEDDDDEKDDEGSGSEDDDDEKDDEGSKSEEDEGNSDNKITNNHIEHEVTDPEIEEESIKNLINNIEHTVAPYQKLLSTYESYFGLPCKEAEDCKPIDDIEEEKDEEDKEDEPLEASKDSLYYFFNEKDIDELLYEQIVSEVTEEIRSPLKDLEEQIDDYREFIEKTDDNAGALVDKVNDTREEAHDLNKNLEDTLENITEWREESQDLVDNQVDIQEKNDDEQSAVMELDSEFEPLLTESESLAEQSSSNLDTADNVYQTFDRIDDQADSIQQSGTDLVDQAEDLSVTMTEKVTDDQDYMDNFSDVMDNSRIDGHPNEDLYSFLSEPVDKENKGMMIKGDTFTPYFLVLLSFIVALFTAYVISITNQRRLGGDPFEAGKSLMGSNALITGITASIGVVEGLVIGLISAYYLGISEGTLVMWTGLMILILLSMVLVSTYLLRQLKMIGMFILLAVMSMYLFLTEALGTGFAGSDTLRAYSPLQYLETMLSKVVQGGIDYPFTVFGVIAIILLAVLANLLVLHRTGDGAKDDEDVAKAQ